MVKITIETGNQAFQDGNYGSEIARILRKIADNFENGNAKWQYNDINGNPVCKVEGRTK